MVAHISAEHAHIPLHAVPRAITYSMRCWYASGELIDGLIDDRNSSRQTADFSLTGTSGELKFVVESGDIHLILRCAYVNY
jgi:hypothetical protein